MSTVLTDIEHASRVLLGPGNPNISPEQIQAALDLIETRFASQPDAVAAEILRVAIASGISARQLIQLGRPGLTHEAVHAYLQLRGIRWSNLEDHSGAWREHAQTRALFESRVVPLGVESELHRRLRAGLPPREAVKWALSQRVPLLRLQQTALSALYFRADAATNSEDWSIAQLAWAAYSLGVPIPPGGFEHGSASFTDTLATDQLWVDSQLLDAGLVRL